jgi:hypothetical protein
LSSPHNATSVPPDLQVDEIQAFVRWVPTRIPFRFGAVTMTELGVVYLRVRFAIQGPLGAPAEQVEGVSSSVLSPMWFDKDPSLSHGAKHDRLLIGMSLAAGGFIEAGCGTAYELHQVVQPIVRRQCAARGIPALTSSFGVALLDGALIDGICRARRSTFHAGLRDDLFGFGPVPGLPPAPSAQIALRHTVGLVDPLTDGDVAAPLADGLPETLVDVVREYGVNHFKVKIAGDRAADLARLGAIQAVLREVADPDYRVVFDGNEQFTDMAAFADFFAAFRGAPDLGEIYRRTLWFEQPVERHAALTDAAGRELAAITSHKPVILDESDGTDETVERALALGFAGVSAKNSKGVFRTLHSFRALHEWHARTGAPTILAAEDLTHPGMRALQQDTAVVTALGIGHAERNGHHYVRGLDFLTPAEQAVAERDFPRLYERTPGGLLRLAIHDGAIVTTELNAHGYGGVLELDFGAIDPLPLPDPGPDRDRIDPTAEPRILP